MNDEYESVEYEPGPGLIPPSKLIYSFLVVTCSYIFFLTCIFGTFIALARLFFPATFDLLMESEPETIKGLMETDPGAVFPKPMYWGWLAINGVLCLCLGWTIARMAPFGKFAHAAFLAVLIGVGCLQQAIGSPRSSTWMFMLMMGVFPIAVIIGSNFALSEKKKEQDSQV